MQAENRRKPYSPGPNGPHGQGPHPVCHSCGWTFPNPHPSAKQRRAHRKHCGEIECFPLASPHVGDGGGSNGNDGDDDAAALVTPAAADITALGGELSDAHPHLQTEPISSLDALQRPAMEEGNADATCGTGEEGMKTFGSVGFHGDEALIGIHPRNPEDCAEAISAPGGDEDLKFPDLLHDKEIQRIDAVNVVVQLENGKQLQGPSVSTYTSNMKEETLPVEPTDDGRGSTSLLTTTSSLHCPVNEMCAEVDQSVLDGFSFETKAVAEERSREGSELCLESPSIKATKSNNCMDGELKSLSTGNFINVLSNHMITNSMETGVLGTDVAMNLEEVISESFHIQEMNNNEVENAPILMKVYTTDCLGTSPDPDKDGKHNNVFDGNVKEKEDNYALSASQMPQDACENNISDVSHKVLLRHEQFESPLPANHESVLKPGGSLGNPELRHVVESKSMLAESRKEDVFMINHEVCEYQGQGEPDILPETVIAEAVLVPDCTIDPGLAEMQSESASVGPSEICYGLLSSGWVHWNNLELKWKDKESIANKSDENDNRTDGINKVEYQTVRKGESGLSIENIRGPEDPASGELIAFPIIMKDQPLSNLIRVVQRPVVSSDHVEENTECCSGNKVCFPDVACQLTPEDVTVEDGSTCGASNLFSQVNDGRVGSCIAVTSVSENNEDVARFHHEACTETNPASVAGISDVKCLHYHNLGDNKMQRNREITESLTVTDGDFQPCIHGFIHLEAWIDHSACVNYNQKEVECGNPIVRIGTEPRSNVTKEKHQADTELRKNELEKESLLTHASPILGSTKSLTDDISCNMETMSSKSSLNLPQESSQNEVHESSTGSACDVHLDIVAETYIQIKPNEAHNTVSPDQEGKLSQNNEVWVSRQSMEIPTTVDMVAPPDMLSGIQSSDFEPLNISGEIASSVCLKSDEWADVEMGEDDARYPLKVLKETISPESTSYVYVKSLENQDIGENKVQRNHESAESVAVSSESSQSYPAIGMGSEGHGSIPLEAWIDYSACVESNQSEVEGGQLIMRIESCVTEPQHPNVDLGNNELDEEPELTHLSSTSDTSKSIIDDTYNNMKSMSSMSDLNFDQMFCPNEINASSRESAGDGDHHIVVRETHFQIKPSDTHATVSEKTDDEKKLNQNNRKLLSQHSVEIPTRGNVISPPDMLSGIQSSTSLEELNRDGKIACSTCYQSDTHVDHLTLDQEDPAAPSARDALMDTISQTDSIEVHWGSVSVLSASEAIDSLQDSDTEALQDVNALRSQGSLESSVVKRAVSEEQCTEIADLSEAPFALADGRPVSVEVGSLQGTQLSSSSTTNGMSPFHKQAICESKERKKKEEIIAKVEHWSSSKQHTPLKTLLAEANHESRHKTPDASLHKLPLKSNRSQAPQVQGFTTGTPAPVSEHLADSTCAKKEAQKEWNSPARLPTNRNDKRKVKGKPQWVPFLCCPSLN